MSNQELREQFARCQQWNDPDQWDYLALEFFKAGFTLNAAECFNRADTLRGVPFAEAVKPTDTEIIEYIHGIDWAATVKP